MSNHTPTPWAYEEDTATIRFDGRGNATEGDRIGCVIGSTQYRTDGRHIVACVNALADRDPARLGELEKAIDAVAKAERMHADGKMPLSGRDHRLRRLEAALAAFRTPVAKVEPTQEAN